MAEATTVGAASVTVGLTIENECLDIETIKIFVNGTAYGSVEPDCVTHVIENLANCSTHEIMFEAYDSADCAFDPPVTNTIYVDTYGGTFSNRQFALHKKTESFVFQFDS